LKLNNSWPTGKTCRTSSSKSKSDALFRFAAPFFFPRPCPHSRSTSAPTLIPLQRSTGARQTRAARCDGGLARSDGDAVGPPQQLQHPSVRGAAHCRKDREREGEPDGAPFFIKKDFPSLCMNCTGALQDTHHGEIYTCEWAPNSDIIATGGSDKTVRFFTSSGRS
jgi:WD40 repeat protein